MSRRHEPDTRNALLVRLAEALGLDQYIVTAIDIRAKVGEFPVATVAFLVPGDRVMAVAEAVDRHRPAVASNQTTPE